MTHLLRNTLLGAAALGLSAAATAELQTQSITYSVKGQEHTGYMAWDDSVNGERPGVLVVHEWWGHDEFSRNQAEKLAKEGYTALALDMYGEGKHADHPDQAQAFMKQANSDMDLMQARFRTAMTRLQDHNTVNPDQIAAQGYCFGGAVVLNMARLGMDLDGVVSFHGSLGSPVEAQSGEVDAAVRAYTGGADQFVPAKQVSGFVQEMHNADVDYALQSFPGVQHSFMNPEADTYADKFDMPVGYDEQAAETAWQETLRFYDGLFD
ncbi:dienelactone hydrolase family protein [Salicola sp. Rm-C-2C1-2]|uniref:dienelactone hydrolase family protein n=1 Tax=Salicola sp. Rm-C-2C1-2 TaxID=3141321 RepID=UPI0032E3E620